jgi:hypothetical protein
VVTALVIEGVDQGANVGRRSPSSFPSALSRPRSGRCDTFHIVTKVGAFKSPFRNAYPRECERTVTKVPRKKHHPPGEGGRGGGFVRPTIHH